MKEYRVYKYNAVDEIMVGESTSLERAFEIARERWDSMTAHDKTYNDIRVIKFLYDIDDGDRTCFDYESCDWFRWYAVVPDPEDYADHSCGSWDWYDAYNMAHEEYKSGHEDVEIVTVDYRDDYCIESERFEDIYESMRAEY